MDGTADTVIIGAGQVGLAMSWCLRDRPIASRPPRTRERSCPASHSPTTRSAGLRAEHGARPASRKASSVSLSVVWNRSTPTCASRGFHTLSRPTAAEHKEAQQ